MAGSLSIRWTSAARVAGLGVAAIVALALLASALEPPAPAPIPSDVGLGSVAASPAVSSPAGERDDGGAWDFGWVGRRGADRPGNHLARPAKQRPARRPPRPRSDDQDRNPEQGGVPPTPPPASPAPAPVAARPAPPPPAATATAPSSTPQPTEFGFER